MDVSIIIVNYNTKNLTVNCIKSVYASDTGYTYEIILVDNFSSDGSVETIKEMFPEVRIIENSNNLGFARANNQAAKMASGRFLYILNSDTEIEKNVIEENVAFGDSKQDVGVIGTKVILPDGKVQENFYKFPTLLSELFFFVIGIIKSTDWFLLRLNKYRNYPLRGPFEVDVISGCSMFVNRKVYQEVGLFDERFFMYYEDGEFCHRVKDSRFRCVYNPMTVVKHLHKGSDRQMEKDFRLLLSCFKAACIYFSRIKKRYYVRVFKTLCVSAWFSELIVLKLLLMFTKKEKIKRKINMLDTLLSGRKNTGFVSSLK